MKKYMGQLYIEIVAAAFVGIILDLHRRLAQLESQRKLTVIHGESRREEKEKEVSNGEI